MLDNLEEHRDLRTGDINCTTLAEDAADHFNIYEDDDDCYEIPEWVYETAVAIAYKYQ